MSQIILPQLPEKLTRLYEEEEKIRTQSLLFIVAEQPMRDHATLIETSLDLVVALTLEHHPVDKDQEELQFIGIRLFNSAAMALKLALSGYYQGSFSVQRDIMEVGNLLDWFRSNGDEIHNWATADRNKRLQEFSPKWIRKKLDQRDSLTSGQREKQYQLFCEYAAHLTPIGKKVVSPEGIGKLGPFYEESYLKACMVELALRLVFATMAYDQLLPDKTVRCFEARLVFLEGTHGWMGKYRNIAPPTVDFEEIKRLLVLIKRKE